MNQSGHVGVKPLAVDAGRLSRPGLRRVAIAGLATYVPPRVLSNFDLEKMVETSDEWIQQRTGIRERHFSEGTSGAELAARAARDALAEAGIAASDLDLIVVGTTTPDMMFPSTACLLQHKIARRAHGARSRRRVFRLHDALTTAAHMVASGTIEHALVVGADVMSSILDYTDRTTCVLFGDGAGAAVISPTDDREFGILDFEAEIDGSGGPALCMPAGGSLRPASKETVEGRLHYVKQTARRVPLRGAQDRGDVRAVALAEQPHGERHRSLRVASGEPAHHPVGSRANRLPARESRHQHRELRQHDRGHDSARAGRRGEGRTAEEGVWCSSRRWVPGSPSVRLLVRWAI